MHKIFILALVLIGTAMHSQIKGKITTANGEPVPFVSVIIENTYTGTSANAEGLYELNVKNPGKYTLVFQSIGYKSKKVAVNADVLPHQQDIVLEEEAYELGEVIVTNDEDPAYNIIRKAIAHKKENFEKTGRYEADFYSKGIFRAKNVPKRIMGMKVEVPEGSLDSTGSGIMYLSETVSHITFELPDRLKENIIASKVSGSDSGYSFNSAREAQYNFYDNYMDFDFDVKMISPLAKGALGYYRYKFEGTFLDENNHYISKIKVIPRRDKEPVFEGYIYIADDSYAIYAVDLIIKGYRLREPVLETLVIRQNFSYNSTNGVWAKNLQTFDISAGMFGVSVSGRYTHVYTNYVFHEKFDKETFAKGTVSFEKDASKKDSVYWESTRPIPLSDDEKTDYTKKDSLFAHKRTDTYKDSLWRAENRFKVFDILTGYSYKNPIKKINFSYDGVLDLPGYNTVQGWNLKTKLSFSITDTVAKRSYSAAANFDYGIAEDRLRIWGAFPLRIGKRMFNFSGGNKIEQFNPSEPIMPFINSVSTLFFKDNYMKLYDKAFAKVSHNTYLFKKLNLTGSLEHLWRRPLYNNTDYVLIKDDDVYTSNNPLAPYEYQSAPFGRHELAKANISGSIRFDKNYYSFQQNNAPITDGSQPGLYMMYQKGFAGSEKKYEYDFVAVRATHSGTWGNKGDYGINLKAGKFFNGDGIAFADYKHFNGNQTHIGTSENYLNVFNLLPYYTHSTNDSYFEAHAEHNFKGFIMNKIPVLDLLLWDFVVGYHTIATPDYKPYHEFTAGFDKVGFGKFRMLRVDYVRAYQGGFVTDGVVFGLKFFL